jgi:hypothetical protein
LYTGFSGMNGMPNDFWHQMSPSWRYYSTKKFGERILLTWSGKLFSG